MSSASAATTLPTMCATRSQPRIPGPISNAASSGVHRRQPASSRSTFGNVNADVLAHFDPTFVRDDFVEIILNNGWPE